MKKQVRINVELDNENVPKSIEWDAEDAGMDEPTACRAMILSMWDHRKKDTMRLDLWTRDMTVDEMKIFFHETLLTMADTLEKSIADERIAGDMRDFCHYFAEKMEIISPDENKSES
ncbi:MAG: gliding motility protein GldC [Bacteroidetes bacterium]|nr:gliding motility protein GldC [Bacteroidota bacterium]MCH8524225.1 gliding motility protein GldC [Balneolales bacterium]